MFSMTDKLINKVIEDLSNMPAVLAIYLFGSNASGRAGPLSDTDLAVFLSDHSKKTLAKVGAMSSDKIDITIFDTAPPYLKYSILKNSKPIYVKNKSFVQHKIVQALKEYHDHVALYVRFGLIKV